jgi:type IV secretion system protein VirB10
MASLALQNSINIPPTGYVNQGERIMIFVARDVDFSNVYELVNAH